MTTARLSSAELSGLWETYLQETMSVCMLKYLLKDIRDTEVMLPVSKALKLSETHIDQIIRIFNSEKVPIPVGFTDEDIDLTAPPLFYELFPLSFVYAMSRMGMINFSFVLSSVARPDIRQFFTYCLEDTIGLYNDSTSLILSKGIYDRPPMIPYPTKREFVEQQTTYMLGFLGNHRPLNGIELSEIFLNIERNYFSVLLCMGLQQVVNDPEINKYIAKGRKISEDQIKFFNDLLLKEDALGTVPVSMEVTESSKPPFSDKLIVALFHSLNSIDITLLGHALSLSLRADLAAQYSKLIARILAYGTEGYHIMVSRKWLEQPPQQTNRKEAVKKYKL
ncbi:DUF3231 family protein [Alicyclobacillus fastidiosus]|uniref:DUF3231 family protein n=1 Tax=Alicyclobacillus fastidiosus TaxID=392011 RepID=A0ABV5AD49_9BACL|nr:DUF3231 family protein [Alicyclobacillus fastidiosus]WEH08845.1 DUF3231 family protein [Alicyclobacillus fastidiosus]